MSAVSSQLPPGSLVRWQAGPQGGVGVVVDASPRQVRVRFDTGEEQIFVWPNDVLERVTFEAGTQVQVLADGEVGVVVARSEARDRFFYAVGLPGGIQKTVAEDGLRTAVITDPLYLLRTGSLDSARSVNLRLAATRLLFAHQFDELSSLSNSRVEIKEHQVGVLHRVATSYPHRFLLADEVGLGKTIEAGLIIKELKARGMASRVLILAPSGIVSQWQFEMRTKFNEVFAQLSGVTIPGLQDAHPRENVWAIHDNVIASNTFAAWTEQRRREIALADWDLVVVDEAHHARRTLNNVGGTKLYQLVQELAHPEHANSRAMLFLTATPMQLHPFELYSLIELLDPTLFPSYEDFDEHRLSLAGLNAAVDAVRQWQNLSASAKKTTTADAARWLDRDAAAIGKALASAEARERLIEDLLGRHRLSEAMIRNRKAIVGGFMPRVASVWEVDLTPQEWEAYEAVTNYARTGYARSQETKNNALGFLMATFQKLNCSSSLALRRSLLRRIDKLEQGLVSKHGPPPDEDEVAELTVAEALDDVLGVQFRERTEQEIEELRWIVALLERIDRDSKTEVLLDRLAEIVEREADAKVLLFTQFRDTQECLRDQVGGPWTVNLFHGQMKPSEKDQAVGRFREGSGPQILISTEAGGEGRNFQFAHMLVNYDLPWNPMKVEQRIGRIDRIGQKHTVKIFNLSTTGTIEQRVLEVLTTRIGLFEETVGGLDPILGEVERDIKRIFALADERAEKAFGEFEARLESRVSAARQAERRLADLIMDTKSFRQDEVQALLERRGSLSNDELKAFTLGILDQLGVAIDRHPSIPTVFELRLKGEFANEFPTLVKEGYIRQVTFDPATALEHEEVEFLAFGNEIVDGVVAYVQRREYPGRASYRRILTSDVPPRSGWLFTYALEFEGVVRSKEVLPVFIGEEGERDEEFSAWLLDRTMKVKREDWSGTRELPSRDERFEAAVARSEEAALARLLERQDEMAAANRERLEQERSKLERFYEYKSRAAGDKLEAVRRVYDRMLISDDPAEAKILPVWAKNLENAERTVAMLESERERRLGELVGREQVTIQHELLAASYIEVEPDPTELIRIAGAGLADVLLGRLRELARETSVEELEALRAQVLERGNQLAKLAETHTFDSGRGKRVAEQLADVLAHASDFNGVERSLLRGAADYFLLVEDSEHDLTSKTGFVDDQQVVEAVLAALNES
jgi:SNF2 family DNA or RNA helicase